jgi:DNA-binding CsgD family transcriptional regulator/tetratricopeptide (TPR) repeat protein
MQAPFADPLLGLERLRTSLPLVGREFEMQIIRALLDTVALNLPAGARALTISGEMGVGKTRLLAAMCLEARERGFRVLEASAYESGSMIPYFPFIEALRPLLRSITGEQLRRFLGLTPQEETTKTGHENGTIPLSGAPLVAALTRLFPELPAMLQMSRQDTYVQSEMLTPDQEKFRLIDAIATLLERAAEDHPILLCVDNLQWADSASLELTLYLTVRLHSSRVALVGVTRPQNVRSSGGESDEAVNTPTATAAAAKVLGDLVRQGMLLLLPLAPLSQEAAEEHLQALLPGTVHQSIAQALLSRAEGNPFFLEELVRTLTLTQQLVMRDGTWKAARAISTRLPENIILAVEERLHGISETCHDLLRVAALFGRTFPAEALAQTLGKSTEEIQPFIEEALEASIIARDPASQWEEDQQEESDIQEEVDDFALLQALSLETERVPLQSYIFCQGIVQEVLHTGVPAHRARMLHSAIGRALESIYANDAPKHAAELARHYALGGEKEATLHWSLLAGEDAARQQAHREAIGHFRLVLKLLETEEGRISTTKHLPSIAELHLNIGDLWSRLGELEQAAVSFQQALQHLQDTPDHPPLLLARANRLLADAYRMLTRYDQAFAHLQAAEAALEREVALKGNAGTASKPVEHITWHPGRGYATSRVDLGSASRGTATERILLLQAQAPLHILFNQPEEAEKSLWQSHHLAIEIGDRNCQAFALHFIGYLRGWGEQIHEAIRLQEQAHKLYVAIGDPFRAIMGEQSLGTSYYALGEIERARMYTMSGMERARRYGVRRILGWLHWNLSLIDLAQGNWDACASHLQQALQEATVNNESRLKPVVLQAQAELAFRRGEWREAEQLFLDSIQAATAIEWFPSTLALYAHFLAVTGRRSVARIQLDRAAETTAPPGIAGDFYLPFLAEGYIHIDMPDRAATYLERIRNLHGFMYYGNSVDRILGVIATHMSDWESAERSFEEGLALCRRAENEPEEAAIYYEQARMALMREQPLQRIRELCNQARDIFVRFGMQRAVDMVDTLLEGVAQLRDRQEANEAASVQKREQATSNELGLEQRLTRRELEVLRLVADGHTDREVADILVISPRTANRHLSNIFVKLDVPGRAAAVAYAIRMGLV